MKGLMMSTPSNDKSCCASDCCSTPHTAKAATADTTRDQVRAGYAKIAQDGWWSAALADTQLGAGPSAISTAATAATKAPSCAGGSCCGPATFTPAQLAEAVGYSKTDLAATPDSANMGLSCGNPTALASLRTGEVVLDLGSGGGFDCFVAGPKVGATGRVIGVDMTHEMLSKARSNIAHYTKASGLNNVEFRLGEIENLPVADASVDVVISNCVLNLSPDKQRVWHEIARVMKPGGRVAVSDLALLKPLPESVRADVEALVGCIAGAVLVDETREQMLAAGLRDIVLTSKSHYIDAMMDWQDPLYQKIVAALPAGAKPSDYITSLDIAGRK